MNTTLFKKYAELRATFKSVHLPIVRCYIYAPFFATKLVSFNWEPRRPDAVRLSDYVWDKDLRGGRDRNNPVTIKRPKDRYIIIG